MSAPTFGQWVKQRRKVLDLTQDELAQSIACSVGLIQKLEAGERRPSKQVAELLAERLQVPPDERLDFVRYARARPPLPAGQPAPWRASHRQFTNLPLTSTPLFGREQAIEAIRQTLLAQRVHLLTLVGPPGIGKTRLGIEAATQLAGEYDDGAFFVSLATIHDPEQVAGAIALTLGLRDQAGQTPFERVRNYLADKRLLLLLDNLEQVVEAAPQLAELLTVCPWLQILATSRAPLHLRAERQFHVQPLALAPTSPPADVAGWLICPAVAFFADRAQAMQPDFAISVANAGLVAEICARLDGLPLAIELVAARAGEMPLPALLDQVGQRLALLTGGPLDLPVRHQTLRDAIRWSYELLGADEQRLFARLAIFVGGCTVQAATVVCGGDLPLLIAGTLARLVDKNLVVRQGPERAPRLTLLETIREYGLERLEATGELDEISQRHAMYLLDLAEQAEPEQSAWLERLEREHDNLRAALRWVLDHGDVERALRLSGALWRFWQLHGHLGEGLRWLNAALSLEAARSDPALGPWRAKALLGAGWLLRDLGDFVGAKQSFDESLALYEHSADRAGLAYALYSVGYGQFLVGDAQGGIRVIEQSLERYRMANDQAGIALTLFMLGRIAVAHGRFARARDCLTECLKVEQTLAATYGVARTLGNLGELAIYRGDEVLAGQYLADSQALLSELGEKQLTAWVLTKRGELAWREGQLGPARAFLEDSLQLAREIGYRWNEAYALTYLGLVTLAEGDAGQAQSLCEASLDMFREQASEGDVAQTRKDLARVRLALGDNAGAAGLYRECLGTFRQRGYQPDMIECLEGLAMAQGALGQPESAARLLSAALAWRAELGAPLAPVFRASHEQAVATLRAQLGPGPFQDAWSAGASTPWEQLAGVTSWTLPDRPPMAG